MSASKTKADDTVCYCFGYEIIKIMIREQTACYCTMGYVCATTWLHGIRHDAVSGKREDRKMLEKKRAKTLKIELNRIELNRIVLN